MNQEQNRLQSFMIWPINCNLNAANLAKAGFFCNMQQINTTVECFACRTRIFLSQFSHHDAILMHHQLTCPTCPFVVDPSTSGNVPIEETEQQMRDEAQRLQTFSTWPVSHIVAPEALARAGFYYVNIDDSAKCAFCKGIIRAWEHGDDPDREHQRHFPECPFVRTNVLPRLTASRFPFSNLSLVGEPRVHETLETLGVQTHRGPKRPDFASPDARLRTFAQWPPDIVQTPESLVQAGFYYKGPPGDLVWCFHCDGGLRNWSPSDDPWVEHAHWFPHCSYVNLVKGQEFISSCLLQYQTPNQSRTSNATNYETPPNAHSSSSITPLSTRSGYSHQTINSTIADVRAPAAVSSVRYPVTEQDVQRHLSSDPAVTALSIGLTIERVMGAIRHQVQRTGRSFAGADALVETALSLQHEEEGNTIEREQSPSMLEFVDMDTTNSSDQEDTTTPAPCTSPISQNPNRAARRRCNSSNASNSTAPISEMENDENPNEEGTDTKSVESHHTKKCELNLSEENRQLKEARLCKICMDNEVGIVFLPCGHLATCGHCATNLEDCPVCRSSIKATVRTFLS